MDDRIGIRQPFKTAKADTFIKVRPQKMGERTRFLTVLTPRRAHEANKCQATRIHSDGVLGVEIKHDGHTDLALFALDGRTIGHKDISAEARSCFLRREGNTVKFFAIHKGKELKAGGKVLFHSDSVVESRTGSA